MTPNINSKKQEMIGRLLESISALEEFPEPPEQIFHQFASWIEHVSAALEGADMQAELEVWKSACSSTTFYGDDSTLPINMMSLKAVLMGIYDRVSGEAPLEGLFPLELVGETRGYIEKIAIQANGCYRKGWYDASAVMTRRLIETLIIEIYERYSLAEQIKTTDGHYPFLKELITAFLSESKWSVSRNTSRSLPRLKEIGDMSAHNRRFVATRHDIDKIADDLRIVVQELVYIAEFDQKRLE